MLIFIGFLFSLIGIALLGYGIFNVFKVLRGLAESAKALGTVTGFGQQTGKSGYIYCPQIAFSIPNGQTLKFQSDLGTQPPSYKVGQKVQVVYKTVNPQQAEIDSAMAVWFAPGCLVVIALLFMFLGLSLFGIGVLVEVYKK